MNINRPKNKNIIYTIITIVIICSVVFIDILYIRHARNQPSTQNPEAQIHMTEWEIAQVKKQIRRLRLSHPITCIRTDNGFIVTEIETGNSHKIKVEMAR